MMVRGWPGEARGSPRIENHSLKRSLHQRTRAASAEDHLHWSESGLALEEATKRDEASYFSVGASDPWKMTVASPRPLRAKSTYWMPRPLS